MVEARICSVAGCGKPCRAKGWCVAHYRRFRMHGDPLGGRTPDGEPLAFLESAVLSFDGDECLHWPFSRNGDGYGRIKIDGKVCYVHRVVCEAEHGPPPTPKHEAAHSCGNGHEGCCNRRHLRWATLKENQADRLLHGTKAQGERHGAAKLTEAQVLNIRSAHGSQRAIARRFGVARQTVHNIISRRTWAHLHASDQ